MKREKLISLSKIQEEEDIQIRTPKSNKHSSEYNNEHCAIEQKLSTFSHAAQQPSQLATVENFIELVQNVANQSVPAPQLRKQLSLPANFSFIDNSDEFKKEIQSLGNTKQQLAGKNTFSKIWKMQEVRLLVWSVEKYCKQAEKGYYELNGKDDWKVFEDLIPTKSAEQCQFKWMKMLKMRKTKQLWSTEEDELLMQIYKNWWTPREDTHLLSLHVKYGNRWAQITKEVGNRSQNDVKNRVLALLKRNKQEGADSCAASNNLQQEESQIKKEEVVDGNQKSQSNFRLSADNSGSGSIDIFRQFVGQENDQESEQSVKNASAGGAIAPAEVLKAEQNQSEDEQEEEDWENEDDEESDGQSESHSSSVAGEEEKQDENNIDDQAATEAPAELDFCVRNLTPEDVTHFSYYQPCYINLEENVIIILQQQAQKDALEDNKQFSASEILQNEQHRQTHRRLSSLISQFAYGVSANMIKSLEFIDYDAEWFQIQDAIVNNPARSEVAAAAHRRNNSVLETHTKQFVAAEPLHRKHASFGTQQKNYIPQRQQQSQAVPQQDIAERLAQKNS